MSLCHSPLSLPITCGSPRTLRASGGSARLSPLPEGTQRALLRALLRSNAGSAFGRAHSFSSIESAEEFRRRCRSRRGGHRALGVAHRGRRGTGFSRANRAGTRALKRIFGAAKRVPIRRSCSANSAAPWLLGSPTSIAAGRNFRGLGVLVDHPAAWRRRRHGFRGAGGFRGGQRISRRILEAARRRDARCAWSGAEGARRRGAALRHPALPPAPGGLALISVWHPSFLTLLLGALPEIWDSLPPRRRARDGPPRPLPPSPAGARRGAAPGGPRSAGAFVAPDAPAQLRGDAHAALHVPEVQRLFPRAEIQPKGLIATEAFVTLPYGGRHPLAIRSTSSSSCRRG